MARSTRTQPGFTLVELMVVLVILAMLTAIAAPRVTKYLSKAKVQTAHIQVDALSAAVDAFVVDVGRAPSDAEGLKALLTAPSDIKTWDGPYTKKGASLIDPWGRPYLYRNPGRHGDFDVYTFGADNREGGEGDALDIGNW
ncbi:MAG TPA: type II secretion system major pseudopilin GspG [Steroidobacteraceae bacterium]|jgi:general secretion pathway protein G